MTKFYHWVAKHKLLAFVLLSVAMCAVYSLFFYWWSMPLWAILLFDGFLLLVNYAFVSSCPLKLVQKALLELNNNCDPYPLLEETEKLLSYKNAKTAEQNLLIDRCVALRDAGEYQKVYDTLSAINIDKYAGTLPAVKYVYYNNLMDVCQLLEKTEQAELLYAKATMLYGDIKNKKQRKALEPTALCAQASDCFRRQDYARTVQILSEMKPANAKMDVDNTLLCAKAYLKLGEPERAKAKLLYVIGRGNKLYCVTEARRLLDTCYC